MGLQDIFISENNYKCALKMTFNWSIWWHTDVLSNSHLVPLFQGLLVRQNVPFFPLEFSGSRFILWTWKPENVCLLPSPPWPLGSLRRSQPFQVLTPHWRTTSWWLHGFILWPKVPQKIFLTRTPKSCQPHLLSTWPAQNLPLDLNMSGAKV